MRSKRILTVIIMLLVLCAAMTISSSAATYHKYSAYTTGKVIEGPLNVRENYSTSSDTRGTIDEGTYITLKGYVKANGYKWYRIYYSGKRSYVCSDYVRKVDSVNYTIYTPKKYGKVTAEPYLNVRKSPSTSSDAIGTMDEGKKLILKGTVTKNGMKWYRITYDGKKGYVCADFVKVISRAAYNKKSTSTSKSTDYVAYSSKKYGKVTAEPYLYVRDKASVNGTKLGTLNKGSKKIIYGYKKDANGDKWYRIKYDGENAYISSSYVKLISKEEYDKNSNTGGSSVSHTGNDVADYALSFKGVSYVWGGASPSGFDCSGFVMYVFNHFGVSLPHYSWDMEDYGTKVSYSDAKAGDVICYGDHVAIYLGDGKMIHASSSAGCVTIGNAQYRDIRVIRRMI